MANKKTNNPSATIKPKKPNWIRACFGLGSSRRTRFMPDQSPVEEAATGGGGRRRRLGLGILRVVKRPWCKKKGKTTSLEIREKVIGGSTASKVAVVGIQKSLILLLDEGSHEAQGPIGDDDIQKEFDMARDTSPISQNHSKLIKEDISYPHKTKVNKPISEEHAKLLEVPSSVRVLARQSSRKNVKRSDKDAFIGMLILFIILVIMLLCGRLCAILCTSVWFYCMPQLIKTTKTNKNITQRNISSVKSENERKKVVLMGFLEREPNIFC